MTIVRAALLALGRRAAVEVLGPGGVIERFEDHLTHENVAHVAHLPVRQDDRHAPP
jgi:hypothetical protein